MDAAEFFELVCQMRLAQKDYFKSRRPTALERAKELERQVDEVLKLGLYTGGLFDSQGKPDG